MCGFVGAIAKRGKPLGADKISEMAEMIVHRGPDDAGVELCEDWLSLAFRRLSILDLSPAGHQPMFSADGRAIIVFNGEVYNYLEIRSELECKGHSFRSGTDTEVVLSAFREWGAACVDKFIGMFAFIAVDLSKRSALIARDQLGIKPLFIFEDNDFLIFCSEVKCLLPYTNLEPNIEAINEYLVFRSVMPPRTMFKGVGSLPPGHLLEYSDGNLTEREYFNLKDIQTADHEAGFEDIVEQTDQALRESVKFHLRSDVELGVQLSGGVDSSLLTAMAARETGNRFHTFSISFSEGAYDESEYQRLVSERYGTVHHDYRMNNGDYTDIFPRALWHFEHPLNDPNSVATLHLCRQARRHITVMLSGEGADESFLGYTRFNPDSIARLRRRTWLHRHPRLREAFFKLWPVEKGRKLFNITRYHPPMYVPSYADLNDTDALLRGEDTEMATRHVIAEWAGNDVLTEAMLQDQFCDLLQWFWRADRMGMASSMELRVPFCAMPMFKLAASIPYEQRLHGGVRKAVLKRVAEKYIGHEQIYRKKVGFGTPIDEWVNTPGPYKDIFDETVNSSTFKSRPFINHGHFNAIHRRHLDGSYREVNSAYLWTYFNLECWYRVFFEGGWRSLTS